MVLGSKYLLNELSPLLAYEPAAATAQPCRREELVGDKVVVLRAAGDQAGFSGSNSGREKA